MIETKLDLILKNFSEVKKEDRKPKSYRKDLSEEALTYEEKFRALPPHERVLQDKSFIDKTRYISQMVQYWNGPPYAKQTPRQMTREKKRSIKEIEKLKKTNEYENFLADRNSVFKPIDDAYSKAKADGTLRKYPSFYIDDSVGFADIGERTPFPNPSVLNVYVDNGYAIGAVKKYKDKDMSASNPTHPYEKLRYLPLDVQNRLNDEVLKPGVANLRAKYPKIGNLYADLDPRDKKEYKAYTKEVHNINKKSDNLYNYLRKDLFYQVQLPIFDSLMKEALKSSIDESYERAKKEGTLLTKA